jgi:chaperonin GroEL (HSP60 family)
MSVVRKKQIKIRRAVENIIPPLDAQKMFIDVFTDASNMMKCTIGPPGGNTLVTEPYGSTPIFPTKDGFNVMKDHVYDDVPYEATFRMIRDLSSIVNANVGDGTTSVVIIAAAIYMAMIKYIDKHKDITPYGVKNIFDLILTQLGKILQDEYIFDFKKLGSYDEQIKIYEKIATIAANNDSRIGKKVASIYGKSKSDYTYIDIKESTTEEDILDVDVGFEIGSGYIDRHMANAADGITAEYSNPLYLIVDGPLIAEDIPSINRWIFWCLELQSPLVIIASEYYKEVMDLFVRCRTTGFNMPSYNGEGVVSVRVPLIAVMIDTRNEHGISRLHDLECVLGAKALTTNNGKLMEPPNDLENFRLLLGSSDSVTSKPYYMRIRGGAGSREERDARIKEIERTIAASIDNAQHSSMEAGRIEMLKRRAGMLQGEMHVVRVGGDSYKEKRNRSLIYEDAIMAVRSSIKNGVTLGGNVSIYHAIVHNKEKIIAKIIEDINNESRNIMIDASEDKIRKVVGDILMIIARESLAAFRSVFDNATNNKRLKKNIFKKITDSKSCITFNLLSNEYESFDLVKASNTAQDVPDLISPGNMDKEILRATFTILGLFLTSNQLITVHTKKDNKV